MKGNSYRKSWAADKFGWKFYCQHASRGVRRFDKRQTAKVNRRLFNKSKVIQEALDEIDYLDSGNDSLEDYDEIDEKAFDMKFWGWSAFDSDYIGSEFVKDSYGDIGYYRKNEGKMQKQDFA